MKIGQGKVANDFRKWYKNKSIFDRVNFEPSAGTVVVQVYKYAPEVKEALKGKLIGADGKDMIKDSKARLLPIGRIVSSGYESLKPDDIVKLPTIMPRDEENPLWAATMQWNGDHKDPSEQREVPSRFIYAGLKRWVEENHLDIYMFEDDEADASHVGEYDSLIFVLGNRTIEGKFNIVDL